MSLRIHLAGLAGQGALAPLISASPTLGLYAGTVTPGFSFFSECKLWKQNSSPHTYAAKTLPM